MKLMWLENLTQGAIETESMVPTLQKGRDIVQQMLLPSDHYASDRLL